MGDLLRNKPTLDTSQDTLVVIDNAPKVKPELMEKLKRILRKVVGKFGTILSEYYPVDENNVFKGYVCVWRGWGLVLTGSEMMNSIVLGFTINGNKLHSLYCIFCLN